MLGWGTVDSGRKSQQREKKKKKIIWPHVLPLCQQSAAAGKRKKRSVIT
jgi:hypothetical protein